MKLNICVRNIFFFMVLALNINIKILVFFCIFAPYFYPVTQHKFMDSLVTEEEDF